MNKEEFHILALKNNLIKNDARIIMEKVSSNHMKNAIKLATDVFTSEQNIPESLIPINEEFNPIWWCARAGEDIVGVAAGWREENKWHWGRFAVDKKLRGIGLGKKIAIFSLNELFDVEVDKIFIEARYITLKMLEKFGCEVIGEAKDFYGDLVTPVTIKKRDFIKL